jgi:predicted transposase/invertase (TIGR01784 family)
MRDELDMLAQRSPEIGKVVGLLKELSADEAIRMQYEAREKALRDDKARMNYARSEGIDEGKREIARAMLNDRMSFDLIAKYSGLSLTEINSLQAQMA